VDIADVAAAAAEPVAGWALPSYLRFS